MTEGSNRKDNAEAESLNNTIKNELLKDIFNFVPTLGSIDSGLGLRKLPPEIGPKISTSCREFDSVRVYTGLLRL